MNLTFTLIGAAVLLLLLVTCYAFSQRTSRTLLSENRVYHWKVYHVTERKFPAGNYQYFEVYNGDRALVLPKEMTGGVRDVSHFHAAGGFGPHETNYDTVLITFEAFVKDERGFEQRNLVSITVRPEPGRTGKLLLTNLCSGQTAELNYE